MNIVVRGTPSDSERKELGRSLELLKRVQVEQRAKGVQVDNGVPFDSRTGRVVTGDYEPAKYGGQDDC